MTINSKARGSTEDSKLTGKKSHARSHRTGTRLQPAQQDSFATSLPNDSAASFRPSTVVRSERAARHLKAELKRADLTYEDLADRLKKHGFKETKASIANKLARATMPAAFFLGCLAALELEGVALEDI
jgi:hypothetical protein